MKRVSRIALLGLIAAGLIYFLVSRAGLTWGDLVTSIGKTAGWALALFVVLTGANLYFGALKWLIVLHGIAPRSELPPKLVEAMLTTALGELVGQAMPVQAGITLVRSWASRLGIGWSFRANLGTTIFEQMFDLTVVGMFAIAGLIGLALHVGSVGWALIVLSSILVALALSLKLPSLLATHAHWLRRILVGPELSSELETAATSPGLSSRMIAQLTGLSILRYVSNSIRIVVVLGALGMWAQAIPALIGFPFVQIITALPITPGNLGVVEWTWSVVLVSSGAAMSAAALFALTARVCNVVALSIMAATLSVYLLMQGAPAIWSWRQK